MASDGRERARKTRKEKSSVHVAHEGTASVVGRHVEAPAMVASNKNCTYSPIGG